MPEPQGSTKCATYKHLTDRPCLVTSEHTLEELLMFKICCLIYNTQITTFKKTPQQQALCPSFGNSELAHVSGITGTGHHSYKITKARQLRAAPKVTTFLCWVLFSTGLPSQKACIYCSV